MLKKIFKKILFVICISMLVFNTNFFLQIPKTALADQSITSVTITVCGNAIIESGEDCDGSELGGSTCASLGYSSGTLSCSSLCDFNTSNCVSESGGGGGGGGGWSPLPAPSQETTVILQGRAYPGANITVLKDGQVIRVSQATPDADFKIEISDITAGTYTFGILAKDITGLNSITFNFTVNAQENTITTINGIFIPPTITTNKQNFNINEIIDISGYTAPLSKVELQIHSENSISQVLNANETGKWDYKISAVDLENGNHITKAKSTDSNGLLSTFSKILTFYIGEKSEHKICAGADLNADNKVNLIDFSIMLYWWEKDSECSDQNNDGIVDLIDFSIIMYHWTG